MSNPHQVSFEQRAVARRLGALFVVGLAVSLLLVMRGLPAGDQLNLLARGWLLAAKGEFVAYGNPMSTGGKAPGGITSLLVGLPLFFWRDHRAPTVLILLGHVVAYGLLDRSLRRLLGPGERLLFAVFYWLNPWRLYFSGLLWNPSYLFLFGALHLSTSLEQREAPRFLASFLHLAALVLAFQVHASFLLLALASALLWQRGYFKLHWPAALAGGAVAALPLLPWALAVSSHPALVTGAQRGFPGRGLLYVFPSLRGIAYWLRYPSLGLPEKVSRFDFGPVTGGSDPWLGPALSWLASQAFLATTLVPLLAAIWFWRRNRHRWRRRLPPQASGRVWLHGYIFWCFAGSVIAFALAPTTIMYWQVVLVFHAAVLPPVLWAGALLRSRHQQKVKRLTFAWAITGLALAIAIALGSPGYRCGGRSDVRFNLASDSPMFDDLGIRQACPWPMNQEGTWWPDVLPRSEAAAVGEEPVKPPTP